MLEEAILIVYNKVESYDLDYCDRDRQSYYVALKTVQVNNGYITQWLEYFTSGVAYSTKDSRELFKISAQAVHKELVKLVELKIIKPVGEGRALHYILV